MTKQGYTALVFVVDASGSMQPIAHDMEGAIEALLAKQSTLPGALTVDLTYFNAPTRRRQWPTVYATAYTASTTFVPPAPQDDNWYIDMYHMADPDKVRVHINPTGGTALYDAIGRKVTSFGTALAALPEDERPEQVIFAIVTDGEENSSIEYTGGVIKNLIEHQTEKYNWNFTYLGANQDAVLVGERLGVSRGSTLTWNTNNVAAASASMDSYMTGTRTVGSYSYSEQDRAENE